MKNQLRISFKLKKVSLIGYLIIVGLFFYVSKTEAATFTSCPSGGGTGISVTGNTITITEATTFAANASNLQTQAQNSSWQTGEQWGVIDCTGYTVVVDTGITLTMQPVVDTDADYTEDYGVLLKADNVTINSTGSISANQNGYGSKVGPGTSTTSNPSAGGGGGYGGAGGIGNSGTVGASGPANGITFAPRLPGSGGGTGCGATQTAGGKGGGAIRLEISGTLTINGTMTANGETPTVLCNGGSFLEGGGGSGGAIYIKTATLVGSGTFSANGATGSNGGTISGGGGGGGGRIAIYYNTLSSYTANFYDSTVRGGAAAGVGTAGTAGTLVFIDNNATTTTTDDDINFISMHFVDNDDNDFNNDENYTFNNITYLSGVNDTTVATIDGSSTYTLTASGTTINLTKAVIDGTQKTLNINGTNATLTIDAGSDLKLNTTIVTDNLTVESGATIDASGDGQIGGVGAGSVIADPSGGGGAGYGGRGGNGSGGPGGGATYGSVFQPNDLGSGGGLGCTTILGGTGGGKIKLFVGNTLTVSGNILANGAIPTQTCPGGSFLEGGGGSGGSVWISTPTITGAGNISANGALANPGGGISGGGGGGGGRVALYKTDSSGYSGTISVTGGAGNVAGSSGSSNTYSKPNTPSVTLGTENIIKNVSINPTLLISDYSGNGRRMQVDWVISSSNSCSSPTVVWSSYDNSTSTSSIVVNSSNGTFAGSLAGGSALANSTTYYACVRDNNSLDSSWSSARSFITTSSSTYSSTNWNFNTGGEYTAGSGVQVAGGVGKLTLSGSAYPSSSYTRVVTINNSSNATTHSNYQVKISLSGATGLTSDCRDIRVGNGGTAYDFWIDSCNAGAGTATIWVKVPTITGSATPTMLLSYGNSSLTALSSGSNTFVFFDDFETYTGWTNYTNGTASQVDERAFGGSYSIIRGIDANSSGIHKSLPSTLDYNFGIEARIYKITGYVGGDATRFGVYDSSGNGYGVAFNHSTKKVIVDKVAAYTVTANANPTATDSTLLDQWDRLLMTKNGSTNHVEIYDGNGTQKTTYDYTDGTYSSFNTVYIRGNYDVYLDNIFIRKYSSPEPSISVSAGQTNPTAFANITLTPSITFTTSTNLVGFVQITGASHAGAATDIKYQLSCDGTNWYYHPGGDGSWTQENNPTALSQLSSADLVNGYISDFIGAIGGSCAGGLRFRAFLSSDGIQQKELDNVELRYYSVPSTPSITTPANNATGVNRNPSVVSAAYAGSLSHVNSDWEIWDADPVGSGTTATNKVWSKDNDTTNLTTIVVNSTNGTFANALASSDKLGPNIQYFARVRHENTIGNSAWSTANVFTPSVNDVPATPVNSTPTNNATNQALRAQLQSSAYSDTNNDAHRASQWVVYLNESNETTAQTDCATQNFNNLTNNVNANGTTIVVNTGTDTTNKTSYTLTTDLRGNRKYYWSVRHQDSYQGWSNWSTCTNFTTIPTNPDQPTITSPANNSTDSKRRPVIIGSTYVSPETHISTDVEVATNSTFTNIFASCLNYTTSPKTQLEINPTNCTLPSGKQALDERTIYYVRMRYTNVNGPSDWSPTSSFTTTYPRFTGTISNQTWEEDTTKSNAFDMDDYFTNPGGETFIYTTSTTPENITVTVDSTTNQVSFVAKTANWYGSEKVVFKMTDAYGAYATSNEITLTITNVNDAPNAVTQSTPSNTTIISQNPSINWTGAVDNDPSDTASTIKYILQLGSDLDPIKSYNYRFETGQGATGVSLSDQKKLDDKSNYYYVIKSIDPQDAASAWSQVFKFTVDTAHVESTGGQNQESVVKQSPSFEPVAETPEPEVKTSSAGEAEAVSGEGEVEENPITVSQTGEDQGKGVAEEPVFLGESGLEPGNEPDLNNDLNEPNPNQTEPSEPNVPGAEPTNNPAINPATGEPSTPTEPNQPTVIPEDNKPVLIADVNQDGMDDDYQTLVFGDKNQMSPTGDDDNDGIPNKVEYDKGTNPLTDDSDNDGVKDSQELKLGLNPGLRDSDGDGFTDAIEISLGTDPTSSAGTPVDSNKNGVADKWEKTYNLTVQQGYQDTDKDGLSDKLEFWYGTDPTKADTDGDGYPDSEEIYDYKTDATKKSSNPDKIMLALNISNCGVYNSQLKTGQPIIKGIGKGTIVLFAEDNQGNRRFLQKTEALANQKFMIQPAEPLRNGQWKLVVSNGEDESSCLINVNSELAINRPKPERLGTADILRNVRLEMVENKPVLKGKVLEQAEVIASWQSLLYTSALLVDTVEGDFDTVPPKPLEVGDHQVYLYAVRLKDEARSDQVKLDFAITPDGQIIIKDQTKPWWIFTVLIGLLLLGGGWKVYSGIKIKKNLSNIDKNLNDENNSL